MDLPPALTTDLARTLDTAVLGASPVGGGCIARACRLETAAGPCFLKWGEGDVARTFPAEAEGLKALAAAGSPLHIPAVLAVAGPQAATPGFLVMEWIAPGRRDAGFWEALGRGLAALHHHTGTAYGFPSDNFIGRSPQPNGPMASWPAFFRDRRLAPQAELARRKGHWRRVWDRPFDRLCDRLDTWLPAAPPPSLLHGDLWGGNVMADAEGRPVLIDPAVYCGDREADLAMTRLFGGFAPRFYAAYREAWPLDPGAEERGELYNLYHLLNHLNLFGEGYAAAVEATILRYR